ncbi:MAG: TraM recognition domain-containing protein [Planctomycetota bacterium]
MSLDDICSHVFAIGGTGSGKTSVLKILLIDILRRGGNGVGGIFAAVKPDEYANIHRILAEAQALDRLIHLQPGRFTYNFLSFELTKTAAGSPRTATNLLQDLNKLLNRAGEDSGESFWANLFAKMCEYAIQICFLAKREKVTIEDVYQFIMTSPSTFKQAGSEEFKKKSFCFDLLRLAESNLDGSSEARQYKQAATFFLAEALQLGEKARGAAISQVSAVISPFLQSPLYETVCCAESDFSPLMAINGKCVAMDFPVMALGDGGRFLQTLITAQVTEAALARPKPTHMTLVVRDELQMITRDAAKEVADLSTARSQKLAFISGCQSIPTLQSAMGGNQAEQELHSVFSNYSIKLVLSTSCSRTAEYFSQAWGQCRDQFVSVAENKQEEELDLLNMLTGNDRLLFSVSEQLVPRCPPEAILSLRRGGRANRLLVDAFLSQAGRTYGPDQSPFKLVTFKQI